MDSVKVAQYEVLGNEAKGRVRPVWDGELFKNANPALRTGLLSSDPCGTDFF
jgi:hypothetical protein